MVRTRHKILKRRAVKRNKCKNFESCGNYICRVNESRLCSSCCHRLTGKRNDKGKGVPSEFSISKLIGSGWSSKNKYK